MSPSRTKLLQGTAVVGMLVLLAAIGAWMLQASIPRTITIATGPPGGQYSAFAERYRATLARDGVTLVERQSKGVTENARLIADPGSGVDVAFMHGGVMRKPGRVVMLAALYYEPLWVFTRDPRTLDRLDELRYRKIAVGHPEEGVRAFIEPLLQANNLTGFNATLAPIGSVEALRALQQGRVDAAMFVGDVHTPAVFQALHDKDLKLMNFRRAAAYQRRFDHITRLVLPMGVVDFGLDLPPDDVTLISTEAMLVARDDLPPALTNLLLEAAREAHSDQGVFERPREFPNTDPVDIPVSVDADRHHRFGPSTLHRYLPFFLATFVERLIILLVPLLVVIVPLFNLVPQVLRWRMRQRIYRWYGELTLLEREVASSTSDPPIDRWRAAIDRIEAAAARIRVPASHASEAYTLREHVALVRRAIEARHQESGIRDRVSGIRDQGSEAAARAAVERGTST